MKKKNKSKPYIFQVSTKPDSSSYRWVGQELSLLSTVILWILWFCRVLSLYQHLKALRRIWKKYLADRRGKDGHRITNKSGRPDIPPMFGEIYFILWTTFLVCMHIFGWSGMVIRALVIYYLFESTVWIFYYTVFRRFFELGYTIYHKLEYLTQIMLIVPTQALCFSHLYNQTFREMIAGLLGAGSDSTPFAVAILGCLFSAIVISMIISTFPTEETKEADTRPNMFVVGCGDVVQKRLYPALVSMLSKEKVKVYDLLWANEKTDYCTYLEGDKQIHEEIADAVTEKDVIWIETPPFAHVSYLKAFLETEAKLIVLEKPISICPKELDYVEKEILRVPQVRNRVFFLSYYTLEKALPLHYLVHLNEQYQAYLDIEDLELVKNWKILLGAMTSAKVYICEGEDSRAWVREEAYGGQLLETFLHNVLIAALFCEQPEEWSEVCLHEGVTEAYEQEITLTAKHHHADIQLYLKKNAKDDQLQRYAEFCFSKGRIYADLEEKTVTIFFDELDQQTTISVRGSFDKRYSVLADMVCRTAEGKCTASKTDGLMNQIAAIRWLLEQRKS